MTAKFHFFHMRTSEEADLPSDAAPEKREVLRICSCRLGCLVDRSLFLERGDGSKSLAVDPLYVDLTRGTLQHERLNGGGNRRDTT